MGITELEVIRWGPGGNERMDNYEKGIRKGLEQWGFLKKENN